MIAYYVAEYGIFYELKGPDFFLLAPENAALLPGNGVIIDAFSSLSGLIFYRNGLNGHRAKRQKYCNFSKCVNLQRNWHAKTLQNKCDFIDSMRHSCFLSHLFVVGQQIHTHVRTTIVIVRHFLAIALMNGILSKIDCASPLKGRRPLKFHKQKEKKTIYGFIVKILTVIEIDNLIN